MAKQPWDPTETTLRILFATSGNQCAFRDPDRVTACEEVLADPAWPRTKGVACHIHAARPGGPRYNAAMTDEERRHFDNIILLCPNHHRVIDDLEPDRFTGEVLQEMKECHLQAFADSKWWASEAELTRYARLVVVPGTASGVGDAYDATVQVSDGDGGTATETESVEKHDGAVNAPVGLGASVVGIAGPARPVAISDDARAEDSIANPRARSSIIDHAGGNDSIAGTTVKLTPAEMKTTPEEREAIMTHARNAAQPIEARGDVPTRE